ncbi:MAG TPA: 2-dehydropantoate 2-reductase, partial [Chthoniobacterales bacterium]
MEIIVVGAGAIGSLYGAKLAADNHVTLIGRPDHVAAINSHGLRIEGLEERVVHLRAATEVTHIPPEALILVTTKVPATTAALEPLASLLRDDTVVLSLQNGLGVDRHIRAALQNRGVFL